MCQRSRGTKVPLVGREWSVTAMGRFMKEGNLHLPIAMTSFWWCWPEICECIVACMNHTLHWKFNLMGFEAKYFNQVSVFLYVGKKFEHTSSPHGERFLFSSCQNTRVIWVFLSSFPDACFELMGLNRSNLLCWHFLAPTAQRVSPCRYIIISFPEEAALFKIERMVWEILGLNRRSNLTDSYKREWDCVDCCLGGRYFLHAYVCR